MAVIRDIVRTIATKHQLKQADAELFVQAMVEVINEGLLNDRLVKIKGLGTFKVQAMKERSSVNVNTGERVIIGEHDKVSFTPENVMRDIINKPFAQFETVIVGDDSPLLNEDFEVEAEKEPETSAPVVEEISAVFVEETPAVEEVTTTNVEIEAKEEEQPIAEDADAVEETEEPADNKETEEADEDENVVEEENTYESVDDIEDEECEEHDEECDTPKPYCRNVFIYYGIIINIVVAILFFILGYLSAEKNLFNFNAPKTEKSQPEVVVKKKTEASQKATTVVKDTVDASKKKEQVSESSTMTKPASVEEKPTAGNEKPVVDQKPQPLLGYDSDPRVKYGAYYIMGTKETVVVHKGQTLQSIARAYLGPDMECYVEAYNKTTTAKIGDKLKIPELLLKKRYKKQ